MSIAIVHHMTKSEKRKSGTQIDTDGQEQGIQDTYMYRKSGRYINRQTYRHRHRYRRTFEAIYSLKGS